jgi:cellulose synthase/poly-beta-1,6-N-acetylglucosamine synthase-like glycosyltransferase
VSLADVWWFACCCLMLVWVVYPLALWVLSYLKRGREKAAACFQPKVSVVIAAHNEARNLAARISNIFSSTYPEVNIEVVVASDGSSDETPSVIDRLKEKYPRIKLINIAPQGGRSNAHNVAVEHCDGEILVFTDAETVFEPSFMQKIVEFFQHEEIAFSSGVLKYRNQSSSAVTESAGIYWRFEYFLRERESRLGIYAFGSGACCAVRKSLYRNIPPVGDVDFTTPLDVVLQGKKCVHIAEAIAYDEMPDSPEREFRARVRMTAKNLYGTIERWGIEGVFKHPVYTCVILLHKIGRWLTPFGMLALFVSNLGLLSSSIFYVVTFIGQAVFYLVAFAGSKGLNIPLARTSYSFCLANIGFFIGVLRAATGRVPKLYKPVSQTRR